MGLFDVFKKKEAAAPEPATVAPALFEAPVETAMPVPEEIPSAPAAEPAPVAEAPAPAVEETQAIQTIGTGIDANNMMENSPFVEKPSAEPAAEETPAAPEAPSFDAMFNAQLQQVAKWLLLKLQLQLKL